MKRTPWSQSLPARRGVSLVALGILAAVLAGLLQDGLIRPAPRTEAAFLEGGPGPQVLIGRDDDNPDNPIIQPPGTAANQSLNNADVLLGGGGNDVLIGLLGSDTILGNASDDIIVGGTEQGVTPNSDIMFGNLGDDVSIWAPGDGSDAFIGGPGRDAQVFGVIDRDPVTNVPTLTGRAPGFPFGVPTAEVTNSPGFCTLEQVSDPALGYELLVRFFVRATGALAVTIRLTEVEQVFCTSQAGGAITFADLTRDRPQFVEIRPGRVRDENPLVARIIR